MGDVDAQERLDRMMDVALGVIAAVATILLMTYQRRTAMAQARRQALDEAAEALAETLQLALDSEVIEGKDCVKIIGLWGHMLMERGNTMQCACGNVSLHCDKDAAIMAGITHTTKYCDTNEGDIDE